MPACTPGRRNLLSHCGPWQKGMPCPAPQGSQGSRTPRTWEAGSVCHRDRHDGLWADQGGTPKLSCAT
jgi:hypothetical protein